MKKSNVVQYILVSALDVDGERRPIIEHTASAVGQIPQSIQDEAANRLNLGECRDSQMVLLAVPLSGDPVGWFRLKARREIMGVEFTRLV